MLIDIKSLPFSKKVNGIIHIGAHECEERGSYIQQFNITDENIIWIDALKSKVDIIKNNEPYIKIFNECISDKDNELVVFKITNNFQSSSFLNLKEHLIEHPDIHEIYRIELYTKTLKTFYNENNLNRGDYNFMNLDIQGAELLALKGAGDILTNIDYIYIEVNTKELYENCALLSEVDEYLSTFHFKRVNTYITSHGWGDAFYIKNIHYISDNLKIEYGVDTNKIDITDVVLKKCIVGDIIHIPCPDGKRAEIFSDPLWGVIKKIFITSDDNNFIMEHDDEIYIDIQKKQLYINEAPIKMKSSTNVEESRSELELIRLPLSPRKEFNHSPSTSSTARSRLLNRDISYSLDNPFYSPNNNKKYKFCIMAIFKNETMNLRIWLDHYLWQGVEHFYLIDNGSTDNPLDILNEYIDKKIVTYYYRAEKYQQPQHYRYVFDNENLKNKTQWLSICDLDEFFFGTNKKLINVLEDDFSNFDIIYTNSYFYGSDNLINHPKDIRTSIIHRQENLECGTKYIFKPSIITDSSEIWIHWLVHSGTLQKKVFNKETFDMKIIRLNHYSIQSLEYFQKVKMTRGDVSVVENENIRDMNVFNNSNNLSIIKDDILKQIIEYNIYDKNGEVMRFYDEYSNIIDNNSIEKPEQDLTNEYILEDDIVLELGARYGSVSCSINKKLNNKYNQISVEPDDRVWTALELNKIKNNCNFNIVKGFVSNKQLNLINLGEGLSGYGATFIEDNNTKIPSYSLNEIKKTYQISKFTAIVADCEGFLEEFFDENPEVYDELRIIIFEADYADKCNYDKIKQQLTFHKFIKILEGHQNVWIKAKYYQLSNNIKIKYGIKDNNIDVTDIVFNNYIDNSIIYIPDGDGNRSLTLGDPLCSIIKSIFISDENSIYNKIFVYGDSHSKFNFINFISDEKNIFYDRHLSNITMFRIGRDELIMNFDNNEHDANSILCFNYGEIDCRCHIQKQINLGNNENEIINNLIDTYFKSIKKNIKTYKKIVIIAIIPATYQNDYEKNYGPITHKHPFVGTDNDRIRYTYKMNKTIQKYCEIYNFIYFDPFLYYKRNDGSLNHDLSDRMVHLGNNQHFLDKFYSNILLDYEILHYQRACIDLNTNKLYIEQIPEIYKDNFYEYERIHIKNYIDDIKNEPNFKIDNMEYNIYKFDNVVSYNYVFCHPEIIINRINKPLKNNITYYFIFDCPGLDAFAHWFYESFIFFQFLEKLNESYSNIKILTTNKKRYVSNFFKFVNIKNEIVYKIENSNNICFIPPLSSLNYNLLNNYFIENLINRIELNIINFKCENKILFMPRNIKDNYFPDDKIPLHLLRERRNQDEINYISDGVIKNGGVVLNTYDINNFFLQFSIVANSTNIILDAGSSYMVNCLALKNKNIIILNSSLILIHIEIPSLNQLHNIMEKNNKITILTEYNNYEDISKYII